MDKTAGVWGTDIHVLASDHGRKAEAIGSLGVNTALEFLSIIFLRWVMGTPPVTQTYLSRPATTVPHLTRSVRRAGGFVQTGLEEINGDLLEAAWNNFRIACHSSTKVPLSLSILRRRYLSISVLPACLAQSAGVARHRMSFKSSLAPRSTRSRTTSSCPLPAAWCSGVVWEWPPTGLYRFGSSPASSNNRTIST